MLNTNSLSQPHSIFLVFILFSTFLLSCSVNFTCKNIFLCSLSKISTFLAVRSMVFSLFFSIEPHFLDSSLSMRRVTSIHGHIKHYILHSRLRSLFFISKCISLPLNTLHNFWKASFAFCFSCALSDICMTFSVFCWLFIPYKLDFNQPNNIICIFPLCVWRWININRSFVWLFLFYCLSTFSSYLMSKRDCNNFWEIIMTLLIQSLTV